MSSNLHNPPPNPIALPILRLLLPDRLLSGGYRDTIESLDLRYDAGRAIEWLWSADTVHQLKEARWHLERCLEWPRLSGLGKLRKAIELCDRMILEMGD